ncbi:MAG: amidohydrolase [Magnetococcus sp. MYC-9]
MTRVVMNGWLPGQGVVHLQIEGERIVAMGADLPVPPGAECLDAAGMAVVPGFVNGHSHAAMTLFRGFGDDMPLMEWLQTRIWPAEARLTEEDVYWGTRLACLEMIRSGTLYFEDMYWHFHGTARAVEHSGLRAGLGAVMIDVEGAQQARACQELAERLAEEAKGYSSRIRFTLTPHAIYTVSGESLRWIRDFAARHDSVVHIHLAETRFEVDQCRQTHGVPPAIYLDQQGLLHDKVLLAHGVHLEDAELDVIAERGATIVTNPISNMKLAVGGVFPYRKAAARGIPIALGTDGAASNNTLDMFQNMKIMALLQKHAEQDPTLLPADEAWAIATGARAPLFGQSGRVAVGEPADFLLLRLEEPEVTPDHHFYSNLVYAASGALVDSVVVGGRILMHNRRVEGEAEIRHEVAKRAKRLCS